MKSLILFVILSLCGGCTAYQYVSSPMYVPLHSERGELKGNLTMSSVQASYSVSNHIYIAGSAFHRTRKDTWGTGKEHGGGDLGYEKNREFTFGLGYFTKMKYLYPEVLIGAGFGSLRYEHSIDISPPYNFRLSNDKQIVFIQPSLGYKIGSSIELALTSRLNYLRYTNIAAELDAGFESTNPSDALFIGRKSLELCFFEPAFSFKAGGEVVKFHCQLGPVLNLTSHAINYKQANLQLGVALHLPVKNQK